MTTLPGPMLDLLTDGVDLGTGDPVGAKLSRGRAHATGRQAVVQAVKKVMLSAHRRGMAYTDVYVMLTDVKGRKLAAQLATGRGGRPIPPVQRERLLRDLWAGTVEFAARRPAFTRDDAIAAVGHVRNAFDQADDLPPDERRVMAFVLDLADSYGTTRPAAPVRQVAEATGLTVPTAHRVLMRLCERGEWLVLAKKGGRRARRSNLYAIAPALLRTYMGAYAPTSHPAPTSHSPMSHPEEINMTAAAASVTFNLSADQAAEVAAVVARLKAAEAPAAPAERDARIVSIDSRRTA